MNEPNPGGGTVDTYYVYTVRDQLKQSTMTRNSVTQTRTWAYDAATARLLSVTHPETSIQNPATPSTRYTYNIDGTVATTTDAKGTVTGFVYDSYKRVTQVGNGAAQYTYTYDSHPFGSGSYPAGRLSTVSYAAGTYVLTEKYSYTRGGLATKKGLEVASGTKKGTWTSIIRTTRRGG